MEGPGLEQPLPGDTWLWAGSAAGGAGLACADWVAPVLLPLTALVSQVEEGQAVLCHPPEC